MAPLCGFEQQFTGSASRLVYVDHIAGSGVDLFREVCLLDVEGIVAKLKTGQGAWRMMSYP